jgi:glycosyltransferase involved in cell wall biosynthesis
MNEKQNNKKIVVFHVITGLNTAGAEMMLFKLLKGSKGSQYQPIVISLLDKGTMGEEFEKINQQIIILQWSKWYRLLAAPFFIIYLLLKYKPVIIQGWMYHGNLVASVMAFFNSVFNRVIKRKSFVVWNIRHTIYDLNEEKMQLRFLIKLGALLSRRADAILFNSSVSQRRHAEIGYSNVNNRVIPNGFETNKFKPAKNKSELRKAFNLAEDFVIIGHVARYHPMKDHAGFIDACIANAKKHANICFIMVGRDVDDNSNIHNNKNRLAEQIEHSGFKHLFYRFGEQKDLLNIYNLFDIFVISSAWGEAFPNVLGEAMACAVPAIVTDVGDAAEIVAETGLVVPPKDPNALADAMHKLLQMSEKSRAELGIRARQRIKENFELSRIVNQYEDLYSAMVYTKS